MPRIHKETDRLIIRDVREEDAEEAFAFMDEDYNRWLPFISTSLEELRKKFRERATMRDDPERSIYTLSVLDKATGAIIGDGTLKINSPFREIMIGWGLAADYQGKGLGQELGKALLDIAFNELNAHRVIAYGDPENQASIKLMKRIGMQYEGTMRDDVWSRDRWWTSVVYSILEHEYEDAAEPTTKAAEAVS